MAIETDRSALWLPMTREYGQEIRQPIGTCVQLAFRRGFGLSRVLPKTAPGQACGFAGCYYIGAK
ncbi:MAG: hypothetical protein APF81_17430 [Desulfosporosinus sp. BRH_c37]|nr:MAG: hypothetical protein APF81_17430 [Desulfosporosinus sp. BRH_c37]